jgi:hypothetical protein
VSGRGHVSGSARGGGARGGRVRLVRREARGDLPLLACLALLVGVLTAMSAVGPVLIAGRQDAALRQRVAAAQRTAPLLSFQAGLTGQTTEEDGLLFVTPGQKLPPVPPPDPLTDTLADAGTSLIGSAPAPLGSVLSVARSRVDYPATTVAPVPATVPRKGVYSVSGLPTDQSVDTVQASLSYISDAASHVRMVAGVFPAGSRARSGTVQLAVSVASAKELGLRLGQALPVSFQGVSTDAKPPVYVLVGEFEPRQTGDDFWTGQPALAEPSRFQLPPPGGDGISFHALVSAAGATVIDEDGVGDPVLGWDLRVTPGSAAVAQARRLTAPLAAYVPKVDSGACGYSTAIGEWRCTVDDRIIGGFTPTDNLSPLLASFDQEQRQADAVQSFALASLVSVLLATAFVAVRLLLRRRDAQLRLQRVRGASTVRLVLLRSAVATPVVLMAAVAGWSLGVRFAPSGTSGSPQAVWAAGSAAAAWLLLPLLTWSAVREPRKVLRRLPGRVRRRGRGSGTAASGGGAASGAGSRSGRRVVLECTALVLAVAGVVSLRGRGAVPEQGVDLEMSAVPVLVGVVGVLLLLRVYPVVLGWLAGRVRGGRGVLAFVALARAGRDATATGLAMFVLVLTLGTAVFGGMVSRTVADGVVTGATWTAGADGSAVATGTAVPTPSDVPAGVTVVGEQVRLYDLTGDADGAAVVNVGLVTVDAARLAAEEPGSPLARALLSKASGAPTEGGGVVTFSVLADPSLLAQEPTGDFTAAPFADADHVHPVRMSPAGVLGAAELHDPALGPLTALFPTGTRLLIADSPAQKVLSSQVAGHSVALLYGRDQAALRTAGASVLGPLAATAYRADALAALRQDGLVRDLDLVYTASSVLTVLFGLVAVALELVLTARERGRTASYLRTLGLGARAAAGLQLLQLLPFACAAAVGGVLLGVVEPRLLGPALDLRLFTGGPGQPALHTDYRLTVALGLGLALLVLAAAAVETLAARRRGLGKVLRLGEV